MADPETCLEVFKSHWQQARSFIYCKPSSNRSSTGEDGSTVLHYVDQMMLLFVEEQGEADGAQGPILQYILEEDILSQMVKWTEEAQPDARERLQFHLLKTLEMLIAQAAQPVLNHKPVLKPLLELLVFCSSSGPSERVEQHVVLVLHQLCVAVTRQTSLLELLFNTSLDHGPAKFLIFSLLIPYIHREGGVGQQARDALLLIMALSAKYDEIGRYIARKSDFCPVLATGLSGLYSSLPRKVDPSYDDWHQLQQDDINKCKELVMFLNSLNFCNAVVQAAHPAVAQQLLHFIYHGFLMSVMGPALHQTTLEEVIAATAYLDLFIRSISEPSLLYVFLKFILCEKFEESFIVDSLVSRIHSSTRLCMVTLSLLYTLVNLNSEDVMYQLVFRYLIPCTHVMVSQRRAVSELDLYSKTAEKLLALRPACCLRLYASEFTQLADTHYRPPGVTHPAILPETQTPFATSSLTPVETHDTSYADYLTAAQTSLEHCSWATRHWSAAYDGEDPPQDSVSLTPPNQPADQTEQMNGGPDLDQTATTDSGCIDVADEAEHNAELEATSSDNGLGESQLDETKEEQSEHEQSSPGKASSSCSTSSSDKAAEEDQSFQVDVNMFIMSLKKIDLNVEDSEIDEEQCFSDIDTMAALLSEMSVKSPETSQKNFSLSLSSSFALSLNSPSPMWEGEEGIRDGKLVNGPVSTPLKVMPGKPDIGPFLCALLQKVDSMMHNSLYVNLLLTGLVSRLACYPQPLLRSFLLNHTLVFQPTVKSLMQVLGSVKHKVDSYSYSVHHFDELLSKARHFLSWRDEAFLYGGSTRRLSTASQASTDSSSSQIKSSKRKSIGDFFRRTLTSKKPPTRVQLNSSGVRYINRLPSPSDEVQNPTESLRTKNAVYCALVLDEFLKELSAISQEHAALHHCCTPTQGTQ